MNDVLVVICTGSESKHLSYTLAEDKFFDLAVIDFSSKWTKESSKADYFFKKKGFKFNLIYELFTENPELLAKYKYFWLVDDDIAIEPATLKKFFSIAKREKIQLSQPAIGWGHTFDTFTKKTPLVRGVDFTHSITVRIPLIELRYTTFVEIMAPLLERALLQSSLKFMKGAVSGFGIDHLVSMNANACVIVDACPMAHTRKLGSGSLFKNNPELIPAEEERQLFHKFSVKKRIWIHTLSFKFFGLRLPLPKSIYSFINLKNKFNKKHARKID